MALFVDLYPLSKQATDDALEFIFKSTHNHDDGIWKPHESLLIRRLIELFTQRGLDRDRADGKPVPQPEASRRNGEPAAQAVHLPDYGLDLDPNAQALDDGLDGLLGRASGLQNLQADSPPRIRVLPATNFAISVCFRFHVRGN
jgi:hypothetical protein